MKKEPIKKKIWNNTPIEKRGTSPTNEELEALMDYYKQRENNNKTN